MNDRLADSIFSMGTQNVAMLAMLRALYATHPEQAKVLDTFDQLIAQNLASKEFLDDPENAARLREVAQLLTRPAIHLD